MTSHKLQKVATKYKFDSSWLGTMYGDRHTAASDVLTAQVSLMRGITQGEPEEDIVKLTDNLRLANAKLNATPEGHFSSDSKELMLEQIQSAIKYVENIQAIQANQNLITEWFKEEQRLGLDRAILKVERDLSLGIDPRFDIVVVNDLVYPQIISQLNSRGYGRVFKGSLIARCVDSEEEAGVELAEAIAAMPDSNTIFPNEVYFIGYSDEAVRHKFAAVISERVQERFLTRATVGRFLKRWFLQLIENFPSLFERAISRVDIEGKCPGNSALVVGSGPSLDRTIAFIKSMEQRPIIICALSAAKALWRNEIVPDFVVILDPQQPVSHLDGIDTKQIKAFYVEYSMNPELVRAIKTKIMPFGAGWDVHNLLAGWGIDSMPFFQTGGSVIHPAVDLAVRLGCTDIGFVGMDLGFVDDRIYASDTVDGHTFKISSDGKQYTKSQVSEYGESGLLLTVKANDGNTLRSSVPLNQYRTWLESALALYKAENDVLRFTNFSLNGAVIDGAPYANIAEHQFFSSNDTQLKALVDSAPNALSASNKSALVKILIKNQKNIKAVAKVCEQSLNRPGELAYVEKVSKATGKCDELTMILASDLIELEDLIKRAKIDFGAKLMGLVHKTLEASREVEEAYSKLLLSLK